jgi:hypothetical protein
MFGGSVEQGASRAHNPYQLGGSIPSAAKFFLFKVKYY